MKGVLRRLPASLEEVCKRYGTVLKSIIMQILHSDAEADDVLQEVFLQVWERAPSYCSEKGTLLNWLCTIARRRAIDRLRQQNAYLRATDRYEVSCHSSKGFNESHTVEREASLDDLRCLLHQHLVTLPPHQQQVIRLAFFEEKSQREISALIPTPLGTVKTRIELGIKKLSQALGGLRDKVV
jgi:RNA polymerase sigma-70 factor (ECF subfamily)